MPTSLVPILDEDELRLWFSEHKCCPDCGSESFLGGPRSGLVQNVLCFGCHSEFNVNPLEIHRLGDPGDGRLDIYGVKS